MRTAITVRLDSDLLRQVRDHARHENRTLTNLIETLLLRNVSEASPDQSPLSELTVTDRKKKNA